MVKLRTAVGGQRFLGNFCKRRRQHDRQSAQQVEGDALHRSDPLRIRARVGSAIVLAYDPGDSRQPLSFDQECRTSPLTESAIADAGLRNVQSCGARGDRPNFPRWRRGPRTEGEDGMSVSGSTLRYAAARNTNRGRPGGTSRPAT